MATQPLSKKRRLEEDDDAGAEGAPPAKLKPWIFMTTDDEGDLDWIEFDPNSTPKHAEITAWLMSIYQEEGADNTVERNKKRLLGTPVLLSFAFDDTLRAVFDLVRLPHQGYPEARAWSWTDEELGTWNHNELTGNPARECVLVLYDSRH